MIDRIKWIESKLPPAGTGSAETISLPPVPPLKAGPEKVGAEGIRALPAGIGSPPAAVGITAVPPAPPATSPLAPGEPLRAIPVGPPPSDSSQTPFPTVRRALPVPPRLLAWYRTDDAQWFKRQIYGESVDARAILEGERAANSRWATSERGMRALRHLYELGQPLLLGSDTPSAPTYGNQPGYDTYRRIVDDEAD